MHSVMNLFQEETLGPTKDWRDNFSFLAGPVQIPKTSLSASHRSEGGYSTESSTSTNCNSPSCSSTYCSSTYCSSSSGNGYDWEEEASFFGEEGDSHSSSSGMGGSTRDAILYEMAQVQRKLDWHQEQVHKDKENYRKELQRAKQKLKDEWMAKNGFPEFSRRSYQANKDGAGKASHTIALLHRDNARLREEMRYLAKEIRKEKRYQEDLERAHTTAQEMCQALQGHVEGLQASQDQLQSYCTILRQKMSTLKDKAFDQRAYLEMEASCVSKYETSLQKILSKMEEKEEEAVVLESILPLVETSAQEVISARQEALEAAGLFLPDSSTQRIHQVLNKDRLVQRIQALEEEEDDYEEDDYEEDGSCCERQICEEEDEEDSCSFYEVASIEDEGV